jgi:hypothetical protein
MSGVLQSTRGISTIALIILLFVSGVVGAVLSYLWTVGYYVIIETRLPEGVTTLAIMNVTFPEANSTFFDLTVLNPTTSRTEATIDKILLLTADDEFRLPDSISPAIPYPLDSGEEATFTCTLNWGDYAGQTLTVAVFLEEGSGATQSYTTRLVRLEIAKLSYDTTITTSKFNMTIRNPSTIPLDIFRIRLGIDLITADDISFEGQNVTFPYRIFENESVGFEVDFPLWNSTLNSGYLGSANDVVVDTLQGYRAVHKETFSDPAILVLSNFTFPRPNATHFALTNDPLPTSPSHLNLSHVTIRVDNETFVVSNSNASGVVLEKGANVTIFAEDGRFDWSSWSGSEMIVEVHTTQGFVARIQETIP